MPFEKAAAPANFVEILKNEYIY